MPITTLRSILRGRIALPFLATALTVLAPALSCAPARAQTAPSATIVAVTPKPASVTLTPGAAPFALNAQTRIVTDRRDPPARLAAGFLAGWIKDDTGLSLAVVTGDPGNARSNTGAIVLSSRRPDPALGAEGYEIEVTARQITIRAPGAAGLFYGGETLRQLVPLPTASAAASAPLQVPALTLRDWPRFPERSLMIDSARHYQSVGFIERTLDLLAFQKLNTLHWHLSDDQGWRLEIKRYPKLTEVGAYRDENGVRYGSFYTQDQIKEIVAYAAARHITIVPELDMPAHCLSLLAAYPENACFPAPFKVSTAGVARGGQWSPDILCAGREDTYAFVENILTEVMGLFPSQAIHIGGDECPTERWHTCPVCQAKIKTEGLKDERALQNYFTRRIAAFLQQHGRRLQGWNEILEGGSLPTYVIVEPWNRAETAAASARLGNDVVVGSTRYAYFDYSDQTTPLSRVYTWDPLPDGLTPEQAAHIRGPESCLWTEGKKDDAAADRFIWPRQIAVAEVGWSVAPAKDRNWDEFESRLTGSVYPRLGHMGLGAEADRDPIKVVAELLERTSDTLGAKFAEWVPAQMSESVVTREWPVAGPLASPGRYRITFEYTSGAHAMAISKVDLVRDGVLVVATDAHDGWAGGAAHDQSYTLNVPNFDPSAKYTLRVQLRSDGGTDSHGSIYIARLPGIPTVTGGYKP